MNENQRPNFFPEVNEQVKQVLGSYGGGGGQGGGVLSAFIPTSFLSLDSNVFN